MELIIAEKPSVGRTIAAALGVNETKEGFLQGDEMMVTWCIGHLVELALPEDYKKASGSISFPGKARSSLTSSVLS